MFRVIRPILVAISLCGTLTSGATQLVFEAPQYNPYPYIAPWPTLQGFEFPGSQWGWNGGRDARNAPYILGNLAAITSSFGTFTFNSIEIGGWPWENFNIGRIATDPVPLVFYGASGELLGIRSIQLSSDNSFASFSENIEGVRAIAIGSPSFSVIDVRLGSITINEVTAVPEPSKYALMLAGLILLGVFNHRKIRLVSR